MAATFNPKNMVTTEFYQEHYSKHSLSTREIEHILGFEIEDDVKNFVDSMTSKEALAFLYQVLEQ